MNIKKSLEVCEWVGRKKQWITMERPTQKQIAEQATTDLGFKVSVLPVREAMEHHGIKVRVPRHQAALDSAISERDKYRQIIVKLVTAGQLPDWLRKEFLADEDIDQQIRTALTASA